MVGIASVLSPLLLAFAASNEPHHDEGRQQSTVKVMMTDNNNARCYRDRESNDDVDDDNDDPIYKLRSLGMDKKDSPHHADLRRASILVTLFERRRRRDIIGRGGHDVGDDGDDDVGDDDDNESSSGSVLHVLFTQRPQRMRSHGGEVCFPGGKQDPSDGGDDVQTAMREAHEEVGLHPDDVDPLARMETLESKHSLCVTPVIGLVRPSSAAEPSMLRLNEDEVEAAFAVPLEYFAREENCHSAVETRGRGYSFLLRTYLYDDPESGCRFKISGLTAHVVRLVAKLAYCEE